MQSSLGGGELWFSFCLMTWTSVIYGMKCLQGARRWFWMMEKYKSKWLDILCVCVCVCALVCVLMNEEEAVPVRKCVQCDPLLWWAANLNIKVLDTHTHTHTHTAAFISLLSSASEGIRGRSSPLSFRCFDVLKLKRISLTCRWNCRLFKLRELEVEDAFARVSNNSRLLIFIFSTLTVSGCSTFCTELCNLSRFVHSKM